MTDSSLSITPGSGAQVDTRLESTSGHHRQVVVLGDPTNNDGVAPVDQTNGLGVDVKQSALPIGAATEAKQEDIISAIGNIPTVSTAGLATEAKQDTIITHIDGLETPLSSINTKTPDLGQALEAESVPVVLTAAQLSTITPPAAITGFATSAKQDALLTELQLKADLSETQPVSLASVPSHAVTNAGTFAVQVTSAPTTTVTATDLDIRDLTATDVVTANLSATDNAVLDDIAANQTDGTQTTQIVDAGGEAVTVTGGKLDVNATASLAGEAIPISGATEAVGVAIVDGSGNQITSFGGGVQYEQGDTEAAITGTVAMMEGAADTLLPIQGTVADGLLVNLGSNNDVNLTQLDGNSIATASGNVSAGTLRTVLASDIGLPAGTNNIGDVDVLTLPALPAGNNNIGDIDVASIAAGDNNIGNVDIVSLPAIPAGSNSIGTLGANSGVDIGDVTINNASGAAAVNIQDGGNVITIDGTLSGVTGVFPATSALGLGKVEDAAHTTGDVGVMSLGVRRDTAAASSGTTGDYEPFSTDALGKMWTADNQVEDAAHASGDRGSAVLERRIDTLANSAGTSGDYATGNQSAEGASWGTLSPTTTSGCTIFRSLDIDETEEDVKTAAGNLYGYFFGNVATSVRYLKFYNATAANVTVGSTTPVMTFPLPASSSGHIAFPYAVSFGTAITVACTTGVADSDTGAPSANDVIINIFYK